ncbi:MAG: hypothetical protein NT045_07765, partial [Candidatus Aureabacteria bacterium]|nr:hypothetical protein [Candidatus Auribacterota bacterium]
MDDFLKDRGQPETGLSDNLLDLVMSTISDRDRFIQSQRRLLRQASDRELRERITHRLNDEEKTAQSLLTTDRYNRFVFIFNTFVRPLSLISVGYFPALIDAGVVTLLNVNRLTELSLEEKKALALYQQFLARYPDSDTAELLRQRAGDL